MRGSFIVAGVVAGVSLALLTAGPGLAAGLEPVKVDTGLVSGAPGRDPAITAFKGIPYAAPPVGDLRWRPPAPAAKWSGVLKADSFGAICPISPGGPGGPEAKLKMSEDCLNLNIWTGATSAAEKRPVIVFLHVFLGGYSSSPAYDGEALAKKGVVVVTLNYRLGPLGFLATPELSKESGHNASGNYGVMDEIAALKWVQKNIAVFGGDPGRVTLAAMSSQRGSSVNYLAMAPQAKGLFQRAISESQYPIPAALDPPRTGPASTDIRVAEKDGAGYVASRGTKTLAELRALTVEQIMAGTDAPATAANPRVVFQPIIDGWVVTQHYYDPSAASKRPDAVYVAGNNRDEGGVRTDAQLAAARAQVGPDPRGRSDPKLTMAAYQAWAKQKFGARYDDFMKLYPAATDDEVALQNNDIIRDYARAATFFWSQTWSKTSKKPMFTYYWTHAGAAGPNGQGGGAGHGSEIAYWFGNLGASPRPADQKAADLMSSYWTNIAKNGDPNGPGLPKWPAFDPNSPTVMQLGDTPGPMPVETSPQKLAFWRWVYDQGLTAP